MRRYQLLVVTLLCGQVPAQDVISFQRTKPNTAGSYAIGRSVKEVPEGYLVFSEERAADLSPGSDPYVTLFDLEGNVLWEHSFHTLRNDDYGFPDPVCRLRSGGFASGEAQFGITSEIDSLFLYLFTAEGDTEATRFLMNDTTVTIRKCIQGHNGDLLFTGLHEPPSEQYVLRTDTVGNIKDYFTFPGYLGYGIAEDVTGDLYLTGGRFSDERPSLIKCDSTGVLEWVRVIEPRGSWRTPLVLADNSVLVVGGWQLPPNGYNVAKVRRYSSSGVLLWADDARQSTNANYGAMYTDAYQKNDGSLVIGGHWGTQEIGNNGFVQGYSLAGDSLWSTRFTYYDSLGPSGFHFIWDLEPTSDGGMILTGEAWDTSQPAPQNVWLVKLDSVGCLVPGCQSVGIAEQATNWQAALHVYPNPSAGGYVTVSLDLPPSASRGQDLRLAVVASDGRVVLERSFARSGSETLELPVGDLRAGMYYVHLAKGSTWLSGTKLMIE